jgi:hypothetical protein
MADLRSCAYQYQHLPLAELRKRWIRAEDLGFDVMWNVDTVDEVFEEVMTSVVPELRAGWIAS